MPGTIVLRRLLIPLVWTTSALAAGLEPGTSIPGFRLPDQNGVERDFESIRGPKGAVFVFYRSADW